MSPNCKVRPHPHVAIGASHAPKKNMSDVDISQPLVTITAMTNTRLIHDAQAIRFRVALMPRVSTATLSPTNHISEATNNDVDKGNKLQSIIKSHHGMPVTGVLINTYMFSCFPGTATTFLCCTSSDFHI
jgi:hypothetical protein